MWAQVLSYLVAKFLGAFVGAVLVIIQYYPQFKASKNAAEGNTVGIFATAPAIKSPFFNFCSEMIVTFIFIFTLLDMGNFTQGLKSLIVGLIVTAVGVTLGGTIGFAVNPARDWDPRLVYTILPVPNKGGANWSYAWVPLVGPIVGATLAAALHILLMK